MFGLRPVRPIANIPTDAMKTKVKTRSQRSASAFVRFRDRIEHWIIGYEDDDMNRDWVLRIHVGTNNL